MPLNSGTRLGPYEITSAIGAGGMGEVYRARDTTLQRDVAIKVLPDLFAGDAERLARFEREAQLLASLNHPNIAHVYGVERAGSRYALVMELIEGEDLSQRLREGPLPVDEALALARQIAAALEAAHEQGIVHRDLKPANIKVRDDATVKVLDFGLAKAAGAAASAHAALEHSPTFTSPVMTQMGVILGTASYMAPEQAKGKVVDRRADVWAFGCVLYEMLTGRRALGGEDITETLAAILRAEPDWSALPAGTPPAVRRLLRRCLEKDPKRRLGSMGDARLELEEPAEPAAPVPTTARRRLPWMLAAAGVAGAIAASAFFIAFGAARGSTDSGAALRLAVTPPRGASFSFDSTQVALSPDGRLLAFITAGTAGATTLWVRPLDSLEARALPGTEGAQLPFWSPDSSEIGFFAEGKLRIAPVGGGRPRVITDARDGRGGTWSREGGILMAPTNSGPLVRVSPNGGDAAPVTTLDEAAGEVGHRFPVFLPGGRAFLYAAVSPREGAVGYQIFVGSLDTPERTPLVEAQTVPVYAHPGYLLFARDNVLVARPFDARTRTFAGEAQPLGDVVSSLNGLFAVGRAVSTAADGTFVYLGGPLADTKVLTYDRSGREQGTIELPPAQYTEIAVAPDGRRVALVRKLTTLESDVWLTDLSRGGASRFTFGGTTKTAIVWAATGERIVFSSGRSGPRNLLVRPSNAATPEQPLYTSAVPFKDATDWSPDGRWLVMTQLDPKTRWDLWILPLTGDGTPKPYLQSPFDEQNARISPDGRWAAYLSDESGRTELYVQSFPVPGDKHQVTSGGSGPWLRWRNDGRELAFTDPALREIRAVDVRTGASFETGPPRKLLSLPANTVAIDMTPDLQRLLVSVPADSSASNVVVVRGWQGALPK
ncbi:MAG TPA: protein kinase [Vicinamibacterales bacterium]|nr:protein kinase [Vicinamibacterales bacterium]